MTRRVHVLEVIEPSVWGEVEAMVDLAPLVEAELDPRRRAVKRGSERAIVPALRKRGVPVLIRAAPTFLEDVEAEVTVPTLSDEARHLLHTAQRRAIRGVFAGARVWHPVTDRRAISELLDRGLIAPEGHDLQATARRPRRPKLTLTGQAPAVADPLGAWTLAPGLPAPPEPDWDVAEALFDAPDDLVTVTDGLLARLHDAATLAAALRHATPRRTHQGHLDRAGCRQLGRRLRDEGLVKTGDLDRGDPRWGRALDLLIAVEAVEEDAILRTVSVRDGVLRGVLAGDLPTLLDRAVRRVAPPDLAPLLGALAAAIRQAGHHAIDEVVLLELLAEQQDGTFADDAQRFLTEQRPLLDDAIGLLHGLGLVSRAPGAFAATDDGRIWAGCERSPAPPVWIASDLEIVVPPDALTPLQRYGLERLARPVARDVVDRLRLDRDGLADWLTDSTVDEAVALLQAVAPAVPRTVTDTLASWARGLTRIVLVTDVDLTEEA